MTTTYSEASQAIDDAIAAIQKAQESASGSQQLILLDIVEILLCERIALNVRNLAQSNSTYVALTDGILTANEKLEGLTDDIKELVRAAEHAAQVAGAFARVGQLATNDAL
ncbi:hypothetical protein [Pelagibius sp.]|uniref:hypothetical protein n=1 Tax=Pelagibius sp. TaxID=1931238 RepID=UPI00262722BB|nr:hypothetical protein [Pelagibius sp.]